MCIWSIEENSIQFKKEIRVRRNGMDSSLGAWRQPLGLRDQNCYPVQCRLLVRMLPLSQTAEVLISPLLPVTCNL